MSYSLILSAIVALLPVESGKQPHEETMVIVKRGTITSGYGYRSDPIAKTKRFHSGMDIAAPMGAEIHPVASGRVVFSGSYKGYGKLITIQHGRGITTHYAHCWASKVNIGDIVTPGSVLGFVGQTGRATGPHLHFEVRYKGSAVDPALIFKKE